MTFIANETGRETGAPIELYEIALSGTIYYLTNSEDEITFNANTYQPIAVSRTNIIVGPEERADTLELTMPSDHPFVIQYVTIPPGSEATMTIRRFHRFDGATPDDAEVLVWFKGIVRSVGYSDDGFIASLAVVPLAGALSRIIPRFLYSNVCNHILYDAGCKVVQNNFRLQGSVSNVSDFTITVPGASGFANGFFNAGFVSLGGADFRLVLDHTGDDLRLLLPFPGSSVTGSSVDVFAGCDHSLAVCKSKFDNVINYGGFAFVPDKNIFETGLS